MENKTLDLQKSEYTKKSSCSVSLFKKTFFCYNKLWGIKLPNIY